MNPFMMMFGPMGFGFMGGGCCCGVNMPYYGMDDRLTFMNFPVFRNTSMDYLLDPRLAMMQAQQSMMTGGGNIFGSTMLPMFNNFPGMNFPGMNNPLLPWWQQTKTETEEERKAREAREAELKDPKNAEAKKKIDNYKSFYEAFKNVAGSSDSFKTFEEKYNEALKEQKLEDTVKKLDELISRIPAETLTKVALADSRIDSKLYEIGYNFPTNITEHKNNQEQSNIDNIVSVLDLSNSTSVGEFAGNQIINKKDNILHIISKWNDTHTSDEKGIIRGLAKYLPDNNLSQQQYKACITSTTDALVLKASEFISANGGASEFPKLSEQIKLVNKRVEPIKSVAYSNDNDRVKKSDVLSLANEFDKLYAMLRIQEAKVLNREVVSKYAESFNSIKSGAIPADIVIKETIQDLKNEKTTVPTDSELDELPEKSEGFVTEGSQHKTSSWEQIDEDTEDEPEKRAQALVSSHPKMLKGVKSQEGIYETTNSDANAPKRYYMVKEDKLVEAKYNETTKKYEPKSDNDTSAVEINTYYETVKDIDKYKNAGKIKKSINVKDAYVAVDKHPDGHLDAFIIKDNKLVKLNGTLFTSGTLKRPDGTSVKVDKLTEDDYSIVESEDDIYTKPVASEVVADGGNEGTDGANENPLDKWYNLGISGLNDLNRKNLKELKLAKTGVDGWYKFTGKGGGYYRYNAEKNVIEKMNDVKEINTDGTYKDTKGILHLCRQSGKPEDYAKELADALFLTTSDKGEQTALRSLHTFLTYTDTNDILEFIAGYEKHRHFLEDRMCRQIATEYGVFTDELKRDGQKYNEYRQYFIHEIAKRLLKLADEINLSENEYKNLEYIANLDASNINEGYAGALDRIIKLLLEECGKTNVSTETQT